MPTRQWMLPLVVLALLAGGIFIGIGCGKSSNTGSLSVSGPSTLPNNAVSHQEVPASGKSVHIEVALPPPLSAQGCGFDPDNIADDDITELVAIAIQKGIDQHIAGNTSGSTNHFRYSTFDHSTNGIYAPDVTYRFTLEASQLPAWVYFDTCQNQFDTFLRLIQGPCSNNELAANDDYCGWDGVGSRIGYHFTVPGIYFVVVDGYRGVTNQGKYVLTIRTPI